MGRKDSGVEATDTITVFYDTAKESELTKVVAENYKYIQGGIRQSLVAGPPPKHAEVVATSKLDGENSVAKSDVTIYITRPFVWFCHGKVEARFPDAEVQEAIQIYMYSQDYSKLK